MVTREEFDQWVRDNRETVMRDLKARRDRKRRRHRLDNVDPRLLAWEVARRANAIVASEHGECCICAPCVRATPLEGEDLELVGKVHIATREEIVSHPLCMVCDRDIAAELTGKPSAIRPVVARVLQGREVEPPACP